MFLTLPARNPGYNIPRYRRCLLNNIDRNSGGDSTDPGCGTIHAGNNPHCTKYGSHRNANIHSARQMQRENPATGWPVPNGERWYWLRGNKARKVLPLGWKGACTLEAIIPNVTIIEDPQSQRPLETTRRIKRTPDNSLVKFSSISQLCKVVFTLVRGGWIRKSYCKYLRYNWRTRK